MKRVSLALTLALVLSAAMWAQEAPVATSYSFEEVNYPGDTFTQLLGINNTSVIAGYHNFNANKGFTLILPSSFTSENYPGSAQTQVIGINNTGITDGFYVTTAGRTDGFYRGANGHYTSVVYPGSVFNQLLGQNDHNQAAGYYSMSINNTTPDVPYIFDEQGGVYEVLTIPGAVGGAQATGINNSQQVCGFYIDKNNVNHGFYLNFGGFRTLDYPGSIFTQALGLNNLNEVVGTYQDSTGASHGFVYNTVTLKWQSIDDPNGVGTTVVNGTNDKHQLVGFWGTAPANTGFVATLQ